MNIAKLCIKCMLEHDGDICPHCGFVRKDYNEASHHLQVGSILAGRYLIGKVIGEGGFGITYVGFDMKFELKIAIKEYFPRGLVVRDDSCTVYSFKGKKTQTFISGKQTFLQEAKVLAKFRGRSGVVSINDFFEENSTVYIAMEFIDGITFKDYLKTLDRQLLSYEVFEMMQPVMVTLGEIHEAGVIHRDISPDNLMLTNSGEVKLLDFGAARDSNVASSQNLAVVLKPGYAPKEQYSANTAQGPWTDIYALCATIYTCITGSVPIESNERAIEDHLLRPSQLGHFIDHSKENALMIGLNVMMQDRYQSIHDLYDAIYNNSNQVAFSDHGIDNINYDVHNSKKNHLPLIISAAVAAVVIIAGIIVFRVSSLSNEATINTNSKLIAQNVETVSFMQDICFDE